MIVNRVKIVPDRKETVQLASCLSYKLKPTSWWATRSVTCGPSLFLIFISLYTTIILIINNSRWGTYLILSSPPIILATTTLWGRLSWVRVTGPKATSQLSCLRHQTLKLLVSSLVSLALDQTRSFIFFYYSDWNWHLGKSQAIKCLIPLIFWILQRGWLVEADLWPRFSIHPKWNSNY